MQHYSKGVNYIGGFIKPNRIYVSKRTKGNFYDAIHNQNKLIENTINPNNAEKQLFLSSMNSYLGILGHYKSYKLRKLYITERLSKKWMIYFSVNNSFTKFNELKALKA